MFGWLTDWIQQGLIDGIMARFVGLFDTVNAEVNSIAVSVGQTPGEFHPGVLAMIQTLSETAVIPIAGIILTFILCYELIQVIIQKNNMHDFSTFDIYKWVFKSFCAVFILTNTFDIVMFVFALAQQVVDASAGAITDAIALGADDALAVLEAQLQAMGVWELMGLWLETFLILHAQLHPDGMEKLRFNWSDIPNTGLSTKDYIAPSSFDFREGRTFRLGEHIGSTGFLQILAPELTDRMLADFLDLNTAVTVNIHLRSIDQAEAIKKAI